MNFFKELYEMLDGVDVTITAKRKNGRLTLSVLPQTAGNISPAVITGTPEELDEGFFAAVAVPIDAAKGLKVELAQFNASVEKSKADAKDAEKETPSKKETAPKKNQPEKKKAVKKPEPVAAPASTLFEDEEEKED